MRGQGGVYWYTVSKRANTHGITPCVQKLSRERMLLGGKEGSREIKKIRSNTMRRGTNLLE